MTSKDIESDFEAINSSVQSLISKPQDQLQPHIGVIFDILLRYYQVVEKALSDLPSRDAGNDDH